MDSAAGKRVDLRMDRVSASREADGGLAVDLNETVLALSDALDLVGVDVVQHGKRVAFVADATARVLGLTEDDASDLFLASVLHDCGVSSTRVAGKLLGEVDWESSNDHCLQGAELLGAFPPFSRLATIVLHHHTHWDADEASRPPGGERLLANLVFLADRVDAFVLRTARRDVLLARTEIRQAIGALAGSFFAPELVEAFLAASEAEAFWLSLEPRHLERWLLDRIATAVPRPAPADSLRSLAGIFARIVDSKSRFTAEHSDGVARLARLLGTLAGLPKETCARMEIAGLLHDLGKLRVRDEVLEKASALDEGEFAEIERHTFETYQILRRIGPLADVALWAAYHHEALSGRGYPFHRRGDEIPLPARLVAVADVFQALAQNRPYRAPLSPSDILRHLQGMAERGKLDPAAVALVAGNLFDCWEAATRGPETPA